MSRRYTYTTCLSFGTDGEADYSELDATVSFTATFGRAATHDDPAEDPEIDDLRIWRSMKPEQRDYDRFVARRIPEGATWGAETEAARASEAERERLIDEDGEPESCSCHRSAPCSWCLTQSDPDEKEPV